MVESVKKSRRHRSRHKSTTLATPASAPVDKATESAAYDSTASFCFRISTDALDSNLWDDVDLLDLIAEPVTAPDEKDLLANLGPPTTSGNDEIHQPPLCIFESVSSTDGVEAGNSVAAESVVVGPAEQLNTNNQVMGDSAATAASSTQTDRIRQRMIGTQTPTPNTLYISAYGCLVRATSEPAARDTRADRRRNHEGCQSPTSAPDSRRATADYGFGIAWNAACRATPRCVGHLTTSGFGVSGDGVGSSRRPQILCQQPGASTTLNSTNTIAVD